MRTSYNQWTNLRVVDNIAMDNINARNNFNGQFEGKKEKEGKQSNLVVVELIK
jgi:hypothetical protein